MKAVATLPVAVETAAVARDEAIPFVVRCAGLPATAVEAFRSEACRRQSERILELSDRLTDLRAAAADRLFDLVPRVPAELRSLVLSVKRDLFNQRELQRRAPESLAALRPFVGDMLAALVREEESLALLRAEFEHTYAAARDEVRAHLLRLGRQPELQRGLNLASRDLAENQQRLEKKAYRAYGRKERSAERSLARYVVRSAVKLSPYSTLTQLGLGAAVPAETAAVRLLAGPVSQRSLVRLKSFLPNQWEALLLRIPSVRASLGVAKNDTLELLEDGRYRLLRPWMLLWKPERGDFSFVRASIVKVRLSGPLFDLVLARLAAQPQPYGELVGAAADELGASADDVAEVLDHFLDLGVLRLVPPWPTYEPHPERCILAFLESSPAAALPALDRARQGLRDLVRAQEGFATATRPADAVREIEALAGVVFDSFVAALAPDSELTMERGRQELYEDVLRYTEPRAGASVGGEILHLRRRTADELFDAGTAFWRIRGLFERRHEALHALWYAARKHWPVGTRVPCLRFFAVLEDTWRQYFEHLSQATDGTFDPYGLPAVQALAELRREVVAGLVGELEPAAAGWRLPLASLHRLLERIPPAYRAPIGPCLLVQPADPHGELWVSHRTGDGSGRYSSRFNTLMDDSMCAWFTGHLTARSRWPVDGELAELVDLVFTQLTTVNRHWPQTRRVFETPGECAALPPDRVLRATDLWVEIGAVEGDLRMRDRDGGRLLPCFLSALHPAWTPTLLKFLAIFGIDTRARFDITAPIERRGTTEIHPRLSIGRLAFRRQRWIVPAREVPRATGGDATGFLALVRWRCALGLPDRVFWIERVRPQTEGLKLYKPQFIDFHSPTLVALLLAGLDDLGDGESITFEEALPTSDAFPRDAAGERWAIELMLEAIAFQPPMDNQFSRHMPRHGGEVPRGVTSVPKGVSRYEQG